MFLAFQGAVWRQDSLSVVLELPAVWKDAFVILSAIYLETVALI